MKIKKYNIFIFFIFLIWFAACYLPFHKTLFVILMGIYAISAFSELKRKTLMIPKLIILSLLFQNTINGIAIYMSAWKHSSVLNLFTQIPTFFILFSALLIVVHRMNIKKYRLFLSYVVLILIYCVVGKIGRVSVLLYYLRNFTVFYLAYIVGEYFIEKDNISEMINFYIKTAIFAGIFGIVALFTDNQIYIWMGVQEVYSLKGMGSVAGVIINGLPGQFVTYDFFGFPRLNRLASFYYEPINFSFFMALAIILRICTTKNIINYFETVFLVICIILTFGKGGLLTLGLMIFSLFGTKILLKIKRIGLKSAALIIYFMLVATITVVGMWFGTNYSYNTHFKAIKATIPALIKNPFGYGIGTVGNISVINGISNSLIGSETGLLNFIYQIGILGMAMFTALLIIMSVNTFRNWDDSEKELRLVFLGIPIILMLVFIFQENVFTPQVITGYMLFQGYFSKFSKAPKQSFAHKIVMTKT